MVRQKDPAGIVARRWQGNWRRITLWVAAMLFTYLAGKLAVELVKWLVLIYLAPTYEARMILVSYVAGALLPVLLFALPACLIWWRLFRTDEWSEVGLVLALELVFLGYVDAGDLQRALASFMQ